MSKTRRPISFIATSDPEAAKTFYGTVLGLMLIESSQYALAFTDDGHMLRVQNVADFIPAPHTVHGWQVNDIEREIQILSSKGVEFLMFEQLDQNPAGFWTTPDGNKIAWMKDPSGNILSLTEYVGV